MHGSVAGQVVPVDTTIVQEEIIYSKADTVVVVTGETKEIPETEVHSPKKAALYSTILPGLGQSYNKKYWKIPLIYGGFAAFGYFIGWNNNNYNIYREAYFDLTDDDPNTTSYEKLPQVQYYDLNNVTQFTNLKQGLLRGQNYYRRNRDLLIILTIAFHGLNIIDASVDAHFFNWDISDDLSFNWYPSVERINSNNYLTLNCTIRF
ncbi:MAG: DUF5683 domain-containing protein [Prolixibacteraceae bacterium]|nr:DUF5683 domain-containing protein [Prolixibacteraceae bacterium]